MVNGFSARNIETGAEGKGQGAEGSFSGPSVISLVKI
jgi:hypothetical protein